MPLPVSRTHTILRYAAAAGVTLLIVGVRWVLEPTFQGAAPLLLLTLAVYISGWYFGMGPALLATALSTLLGVYLLISPHASLALPDARERVQVGLYVGTAVLISVMSGRLRRVTRSVQASERRFRETFEQAAVGMAHVGVDGRWLLVNRRLCEIVGRSIDGLMGTTFQAITHPDDLNADVAHVGRMLAGEIDRYAMEKRYLTPDGGVVWANLTVSLVRDGTGAPAYFVSVIEDITPRKQAEAQVRSLQEDLEVRVEQRTRQLAEANQQLEAFSYSVSHDLRAPLRGIQGFARALAEDAAPKLDHDERDYLGRIEAGAARMEQLIEDLLAYSRLSREELPRRPLDLHAVVEDALDRLAADVRAADADVELDPFCGPVSAHPPTLTRVVQNLIANAIKFVGPGGRPRVRIRCEQRDGRVRLWVEDDGIGIAPEHQERVFAVFERLHSADHYPGTGIGLATVRKSVERMGGTCGVVSSLGNGSRFWVEFAQDQT